MKINDFIHKYESNSRYYGLSRVRMFINQEQKLFVVFTDLEGKNPAGSVTNDLERIYISLLNRGIIDERFVIIEHYEKNDDVLRPYREEKGEFSIVELKKESNPKWTSCSCEYICSLLDVEEEEFTKTIWDNKKLLCDVERYRMEMNVYMDYLFPQDPRILKRKLEIADNMISKKELQDFIESEPIERRLLEKLKTDLSIFAELYAETQDEYICFSEFPLGDGGVVDFVVFSGRSRMNVTLIEVKGAEFNLIVNCNGYKNMFARKMEIALTQVRSRSGYISRNYNEFRENVHKVRERVENGETLYNSLVGPKGSLQVDSNKDIYVRYYVIGGRTQNDIEESRIRHEYLNDSKAPIYIETWDTILRKLRRE